MLSYTHFALYELNLHIIPFKLRVSSVKYMLQLNINFIRSCTNLALNTYSDG